MCQQIMSINEITKRYAQENVYRGILRAKNIMPKDNVHIHNIAKVC